MKKIKTIAVGCDHAGFPYKKLVIAAAKELDLELLDFGTNTTDSVDYPDFIHPLAQSILSEEADLGIIICGSGNGVAMTANKHAGIRAAVCWNTELASLARQHNNANVLSIASRFVSEETATEIIKQFLTTTFEGGRHQRRVNKIDIHC